MADLLMAAAQAESSAHADKAARRRSVAPVTPVSDLARRDDEPSRPSRTDRATALLFGGGAAGFAVAEAGRALGSTGVPTPHQMLTAALLGVIYVLAFRTEFTSSNGSTVATQPVLVAMLLTLPSGWTPLVALAAILVASSSTWPHSQARGHATLLVLASGLHVAAPVATLQALATQGVGGPLALGLAVLAQVLTEVAVVSVRARIGGVRWGVLAPQLVWASTIDLLLSAIGWCIVQATGAPCPGCSSSGSPCCWSASSGVTGRSTWSRRCRCTMPTPRRAKRPGTTV
ncbi:hypothetical protein [Arsenicicoccus piscis]|nr:hypothetical protein [Arsenicicoccus piscis]